MAGPHAGSKLAALTPPEDKVLDLLSEVRSRCQSGFVRCARLRAAFQTIPSCPFLVAYASSPAPAWTSASAPASTLAVVGASGCPCACP
eukprot:3988248-Pleurochrysis_carterae.AAC.1